MRLVDIQTSSDQDSVLKDLGPLSWVIEELRKSFDVSIKGLKRFVQEAGSTKSDLAVFDTNLLRTAKHNFHQVSGVLQLLEINETVVIADAMESVSGRFIQKPALLTEDSVGKLEHASFAVLEYLESLLAGKKVSSIGLFSQYRDIKLLAGFDRVHPADLWTRQPFQWLEPELPAIRSLDYSTSVRADLDSAILRVMQSADTVAADELCQTSLSLAQSQKNTKAATFWKICAAFFEALAQKLIPVDIYAKRSAAGIVIHYNNLKHGDWVFSDKFMQNVLFLCAQANIEKKENSPCLTVIQKTWALNDSDRVNYEISQFGRFDPAILALSKKRIIVAKELWTALSGGDIHKIRSTAEQFKLVSESLVKLYPSSQTLAQALVNASDSVLLNKEAPSAEFAMEVATAILYLEAVFDGWGSTDSEMELRAEKLAQRIEHVRNGGQAETVEPWIEELYRRVSDRESMGSVVGELRICLTDVEKSIDQYFRSPAIPQILHTVPGKLSQMRGIFSVLGLDEASSAVADMRDRVEEFEFPDFNFEQARVTGAFDKFGNNLGALGFLIDMLNYQPALVKKLFVFDAKTGVLNPLMGRVKQTIDSYTPQVEKEAETALIPVGNEFPSMFVGNSTSPVIETFSAVETAKENAVKSIAKPVAKKQISEMHELTDIFLEEATEVIQTGLASAHSLLEAAENLEQQSTLRRAFHTLKGSSRMVGFDDFGEAGWAFEQVINTRLTDQTPFDKDICNLAIAALNSFKSWTEDLSSRNATQWNSQTFKRCAEAMRIEGRLDTTGLIGGESVPGNLETSLKPHAEDEAFLHSLENFELLELPAVSTPKEVVGAAEEVEAAATAEIVESTIANTHVSELKVEDEVLQVSELVIDETPVGLVRTDAVVNFPVPVVPVEDEEQFKVIGTLKIGIPLYNVYLNEADEWSRCLVTELDEWAIEHHKPLSISTVNFAHSLAGSSATVGFHQLSGLAKKLEHALEKVSQKENGTDTEALVFAQAAEECRRLLHQFAAGFLEDPKASVLARLESLKFSEPKFAAKDNILPIATAASVIDAAIVSTIELPQDSPKVIEATQIKLASVDETLVISSIASQTDYSKQVIAHRVVQDVDNDDDIDLIDSLDPDLFHVFEEEARDLLPNLGSSLRQWVSHPDDMNARSEALRTLHTLKGSSRLAGAMRLGELSHRMESEIESLGSENLTSKSIEPLLTRLDGLQTIFEVITKPLDALDITDLHLEKAAKSSNSIKEEINLKSIEVKSPNEDRSTTSKLAPSTAPSKSVVKPPAASILKADKRESRQSVRVRARLLDRLVNQAGEVMLTRTRIESELGQLRGSLGDLTGNLDRLRQQLRDVEFQAETQMQSRMEQAKDSQKSFDPLEFDRFTRVQELTRMMAESVNDVATVQRNLQRTVDSTEDDLVAQARQTRDLQRDLLRTRMEEFESISDRLYRVVRQASKDAEKQVKLDIVGGSIEMDRGVLERMTPSFEHLLRNCIAHGLEHADKRLEGGKDSIGAIAIRLMQDGNDVVIEFSDDGAGLNYPRIREQALSQKLISQTDKLTDAETVNLIFTPGLSTAAQVTELSGRGIGLDVVRAEVIALGGRIDVSSEANKGTKFKLVLPLTTAVTQVVMMRTGSLSFGVPSHLVEVVRRSLLSDVEKAYADGFWGKEEENIPFYWSGALLQASQRSNEPLTKTNPVVIFRSAGQRIAIHIDEIFGNKEVVIKNLGPQLAKLPGLAGMAILVSGAVALIYNPVALASVYGSTVQQFSPVNAKQDALSSGGTVALEPSVTEQQTPLILVVDDSITVRRVTQRMLQREGFRVVLAVDGLQAIEKLNQEIPAVVLSDIEMPRMDGFDLVRNIRADSKLKHLPVVMITSRIAEKHRELAMELGVNDYLGKPYSEEGLLAVLRQHTSKKLLESGKV
jgi:chemosensory pili system protein ChpA (sensor histidine kinase/response regulator)